MSDEHPYSLVDYERTACLCDVGQPDYWAAVCVTASGGDVLWLVCKDELGAEHPRCGTADQPHDQIGPLPDRYRLGLQAVPIRCGRPTKSGAPCRTPVHQSGVACAWHRSGART